MKLEIRKEYIKKSVAKQFEYVFSFKKVLWRFLIAVLAIIAIFLLNPENIPKAVPYAIFALISVPFIFIYIQYSISNYRYHVYLSRGKDTFTVIKNGIHNSFNKKNIETINYYHSFVKSNNSKRTLFQDTAYMQIKFQNGNKILLNTLTLDREQLDLKFREQKIKMHVVFIPYIR